MAEVEEPSERYWQTSLDVEGEASAPVDGAPPVPARRSGAGRLHFAVARIDSDDDADGSSGSDAAEGAVLDAGHDQAMEDDDEEAQELEDTSSGDDDSDSGDDAEGSSLGSCSEDQDAGLLAAAKLKASGSKFFSAAAGPQYLSRANRRR